MMEFGVHRSAFTVRRSAFGVRGSAFGSEDAVGTRSRAIRRRTSLKLRSQKLDRLAAVLFDSVLLNMRRRIVRGWVHRRTPNGERPICE
jgi:hypothetical protein